MPSRKRGRIKATALRRVCQLRVGGPHRVRRHHLAMQGRFGPSCGHREDWAEGCRRVWRSVGPFPGKTVVAEIRSDGDASAFYQER